MRKFLSLLSFLTISGASVPMVVATAPYQKQETKKLIRIKKATNEETQIPIPEIENVRRENQITITENDINIISRPEWNSTNFLIQVNSNIIRRIGAALRKEQTIGLISAFIGALTADFCSTYLGFPFANTVGMSAGESAKYCMQTNFFQELIKIIIATIDRMNSGLFNISISNFFVPVSLSSPNGQVVYSPIYRQYDEESLIEFAGRRIQRPSLASLENWSNYETRINMSVFETTTKETTTITILDKTNLASLSFRTEL